MATRGQRIVKRLVKHGIDESSIWSESGYGSVWRWSGNLAERIDQDNIGGLIAILPYTVSGDYVGSRAETSNCNHFAQSYDIVRIRHEGYGASMAIVSFSDLIESISEVHEDHAIWDDLHSLQDYPVLDECDMSSLEMEDMSENWESWGRRDLVAQLEKMCQCDIESIEALEEHERFHIMLWDMGHAEGCSWYFDVERMADAIADDAELLQLVELVDECEGA